MVSSGTSVALFEQMLQMLALPEVCHWTRQSLPCATKGKLVVGTGMVRTWQKSWHPGCEAGRQSVDIGSKGSAILNFHILNSAMLALLRLVPAKEQAQIQVELQRSMVL